MEDQAEERRKNMPVLAKVEEMNQNVGDADSEALGKLQEEMYSYTEKEIKNLKELWHTVRLAVIQCASKHCLVMLNRK